MHMKSNWFHFLLVLYLKCTLWDPIPGVSGTQEKKVSVMHVESFKTSLKDHKRILTGA